MGVADSVGDDLTFWILTDDTDQVIARSVLRPADSGGDPNARLPEVNESTSPENSEVEVDQSDGGVQLISIGETNASSGMPVFDPDTITGYNIVREHGGRPTKMSLPRVTHMLSTQMARRR